jgi:hypothetical protein
MNNYLDLIARSLIEIDDKIEFENIQRDLEMLYLRIQSQEYKNTDFLNRQEFDTPRRTYEFFNYLQGYYKHSCDWALLLKKIPLEKMATIFDFCPGSSPKIQWALKILNYQQRIFIFDNDPIACDQMKLLLNILAVNYEYTFLQQDIFYNHHEQADLITANHIFDDLVLNDYCQRNAMNIRSIYGSEKLLRSAIQDIPNHFNKNSFLNNLIHAINQKLKQDGYLIMTHYFGLTEKALNLSDWSKWIQQLLTDVYQAFLDFNYSPFMPLNACLADDDKQYFILRKGNGHAVHY